ncbi:Transposase IS4 [Popillia japonica]|uniref:Transposase IS4 n=1 Tax=Popillia japonica TaxID=7064 RepID=A0AAW1HR16_POPJA
MLAPLMLASYFMQQFRTRISKYQERLQRLFAEVEGEEQADDDDEVAGAEEDATEIQEEVSDTEQEGDSSEEEEIAEKKGKCVYFLGRDKTSQWNKHCPSKKVFFPEEILRIIVENTNKFITSISENYSTERDAMPTDIVEIKALLGLVYLSGVLKSSRLNVDELWDKNGCGVERFRLTMSKQRFLFLLRSLRFDDRLTREERKQVDKLAPIRDTLAIL